METRSLRRKEAPLDPISGTTSGADRFALLVIRSKPSAALNPLEATIVARHASRRSLPDSPLHSLIGIFAGEHYLRNRQGLVDVSLVLRVGNATKARKGVLKA